jgi:CYTH domain-containing protein
MPIENERKFVLDDAGGLEARVGATPGVERSLLQQAYLESAGVRIRSMEGPDGKRHVFTYKCTVDGQVVEIETAISASDFARLWTQRQQSLSKVRYSWPDGVFHWDVDFFKRDDGTTYFAQAEVEMPEDVTVPPPLPAVLAGHLLAVVPAGDSRFASKYLTDQEHARRLLADIHQKGRIE